MKMFAEEHLKKFEKCKDTVVEDIAKEICKEMKITPKIGSFHAGAETHVYAYAKNKSGKPFKPFLFGLADIKNMHSPDEQVDAQSLIKGAEFLQKFFIRFNEKV